MTGHGKGEESPVRTLPPWFAVTTALLLVIFFGWMTYEMFVVRIDSSDAEWARSLGVYTGIESFALAGAGLLLGTQIQAGRVRAAVERAKRHENEAKQANQKAREMEDDLGGYRRIVEEVRRTLAAPAHTFVTKDDREAELVDARIVHARHLLEELPLPRR